MENVVIEQKLCEDCGRPLDEVEACERNPGFCINCCGCGHPE